MLRVRIVDRWGVFLGVFGFLMVASVFVFGRSMYGATNWISIGGFSLQPSELAKIVFVFFVAAMLARDTSFKRIVITTAAAAAYVLVLVVERDLGAAVIFFVTYLVMLYVATRQFRYMALGLSLIHIFGDDITVLIKDIQGEKIALSLKFADQNPWLTADEKYAVGNVVEGKVARMTDFGAFIELEPGVDALLHVSQISREHVEKPADVLQVGEIITAKVVDFNGEERKISLSIKAMEMPAKEETVEE